MSSIADVSVTIQTSAQSIPTPPSWFGEAALLAHRLRQQGVLDAISTQVRFARRRFGHFQGPTLLSSSLGMRSHTTSCFRIELGV